MLRIESVPDGDPNEDNLAAGTQLAKNHQKNGCIDGIYDFPSIHIAKDFANLSLDFTKKRVEKSITDLNAHNFFSEPVWTNG